MRLLSRAKAIADQIVGELRPFCQRVEIAGSIRRQCSTVNDIDLVVIPSDLAGLRERVFRNSTVIQDGPLNLSVRLADGSQLDIFFAHAGKSDLLESTPSNWGSILLCRTGSKEHNIKLASRARAGGRQWKTYEGIFYGDKLIASATEEEIFAALAMDFVPPEKRI
jgi:DNA polymerase (family X)